LAHCNAGQAAAALEHGAEYAWCPVVRQAVEPPVPSGRAQVAEAALQNRLAAAPDAGERQRLPHGRSQGFAHLLGAGLRRHGEPDQPVVEELGVPQVSWVGTRRHLDDGQADPIQVEVNAERPTRHGGYGWDCPGSVVLAHFAWMAVDRLGPMMV
jgi:hypothetical protein